MNEEKLAINETKPLLTIAIPTYNRVRYLKQLLTTLARQLAGERRVELIVSDNASVDETPSVVEEFVKQGLHIRYFRNESNVGADQNFIQCFELARGKYVWVFGDDDIIADGAILAILSQCETKDYDIVFVNSFPLTDASPTRTIHGPIRAIEILDARDFARRVNIFLTFISVNILNKDRILTSAPAPFSELLGTTLVQLGWTYAALSRFERGLFIQERLIGARANAAGGYKLLEVFGPLLKKITQERLPQALAHIVLNGTIQRFWPTMLYQYTNSKINFLSAGQPHQVLGNAFSDNFRYWVFAFPIIALPQPLAACWLIAVRVVNRIDKALGFLLLR
ncbi:MAG: glycosyltransferase family 2 protein [Terracidiphilus sp.]